MPLLHVPVGALPPERFKGVISGEQSVELDRIIVEGRRAFRGRVVWNVNSTATGGGVAEMLRSLIAYARGGGVDARWVVIEAGEEFFRVTKRIHNRLHGAPGDGGRLGKHERAIYERTLEENARQLGRLVRSGDLVLLHDPQTAGLAAPLRAAGAHIVWRCHIGLDNPNRLARSAWRFLLPYVRPAEVVVFSRRAFAWDDLDPERIAIIHPSIDAFSPKNQDLPREAVRAILRTAGLVQDGHAGDTSFERLDGTPGRVDRRAALAEDAPPPESAPLVAQVSRWDRLKDPVGVMEAFAAHIAPRTGAHLVLAGPDVLAVADDPEGAEVLREAIARREALGREARSRVHLARLPMIDSEENAAIVNALQRHAHVVVQKSLAEGFGLTVAEGMWKGRPVVASRVGGIHDQIVDGESGFLVDPADLERFGEIVVRLLDDAETARRVGERARARIREHFLGPRHLAQYLALFERVARGAPP
jgi:trehalose synthase